MATSLARSLLTRAARRSTASLSIANHNIANHNILRWFSSYPPHEVVGMPSLSPTMESGTISSWNVSEGDSFGAGDVLCSVETDKATVDFEAQDDGIVAKIIAEAGPREIACGTPIMVTVEEAASVAAFKDFAVDVGAAAAAAAPANPSPPAEAPVAAAPTPAAPAAAPPATTPAAPSSSLGRVVASPRAHTLAKQKGYGEISALRIVGTGPGGRIIAQDVLDYDPSSAAAVVASESVAAPSTVAAPSAAPAVPAAQTKSAPPPPPTRGPGYVDHALPPHAAELASRLHASKRNVPHYYLTIDVALDRLLALRSELNSTLKLDGDASGISVNDLLLKAAAAAMKTIPAANASWMDDSFVRVYDSVDINVVVGSGSTLYSPVIKDVGKKGLMAVSREFSRLSSVANRSDDDDDDDDAASEGFGEVGTFTVVNLGMFGIKSCAPIVREPQACALALGAIENRIVPNDGGDEEEIYRESVMMTATLSCDHRVVDGAVGAQWLAAFKNHVENPVTLLL
ncbi:hypothetical protein ACHAXS_005883 [Conticribra weissflogii]